MSITENFLVNTKNFESIIEELRSVKELPGQVNNVFLEKLGYSNPSDLLVLHLFKDLRMLNHDNTPTPLFSKFRNDATSDEALAEGITNAYSDMFEANPSVYKLQKDELKEEFKKYFGSTKSDLIIKYMANTFLTLVNYAGLNTVEKAAAEFSSGSSSQDETHPAVSKVSEQQKNGTHKPPSTDQPSDEEIAVAESNESIKKEEKGKASLEDFFPEQVDKETETQPAESHTPKASQEPSASTPESPEPESQASQKQEQEQKPEPEPKQEPQVSEQPEEPNEPEVPQQPQQQAQSPSQSKPEPEPQPQQPEPPKQQEQSQEPELPQQQEPKTQPQQPEEPVTQQPQAAQPEPPESFPVDSSNEDLKQQIEEKKRAIEEQKKQATEETAVNQTDNKETPEEDIFGTGTTDSTSGNGTDNNSDDEMIDPFGFEEDTEEEAAATEEPAVEEEISLPKKGDKDYLDKAFIKKAELLYKMEKYEEALPAYKAIVDRYRNSDEPFFKEHVSKAIIRRASILGELGRHDEALSAYNDVIGRFENSDIPEYYKFASEALIKKVEIMEKMGLDDQLFPLYSKVVQRLGDSSDPRFVRHVDNAYIKVAKMKMDSGEPEHALKALNGVIKRFEQANRENEFLEEAMYQKAELLEQLGQDEAALEAYESFLSRFGSDS